MRKILLFVWACMGLVCLMSACKTSVKSKEWKLVWVEDFDQKNSFDESVWTKIPRGTSDWNNYMSYYDSCYAMQDGNLILRGIANHTQKNDTLNADMLFQLQQTGILRSPCSEELQFHLGL